MFAGVLKNEAQKNVHKYSHPWVNTCQNPLWQQLQLWVFLGESLRAFHTWIVQYLHIIHYKMNQSLSSWLLIIARQPFSSLTVTRPLGNMSCSLGKQLQYTYIWSCVLGYCPADRWSCIPVSVGKQTEQCFPLGFCLCLALFRLFLFRKTP
jgi:hypothetical protein